MGYFSDRERGPRPRTNETIPPSVWAGVVAAISGRIANGAFGHSFPEVCPDGRGTVGTDADTMGDSVIAEIPELADAESTGPPRWHVEDFTGWPLHSDRVPPTLAVLDLVEFCDMHVADPVAIGHHDFYGHAHLRFETVAGKERWRRDINRLFSRNGLAYELLTDGEVARLGTPILTDSLQSSSFSTGDSDLDDLLERARQKYLAPDPVRRAESLEQLWDAFERTKTLLDPDKRVGMRQLIDRASSSPELAANLESEARVLTTIGNDFRIRHHETTKVPVSPDDVDYLFHRCFALLAQLLGLNPS